MTGITRAHNGYRNNVGSPPLVCDPGIAIEAQAWADYLYSNQLFQHNPDFASFSDGENIASTWETSAADAVAIWAAEIIYTENHYCPRYSEIGFFSGLNP